MEYWIHYCAGQYSRVWTGLIRVQYTPLSFSMADTCHSEVEFIHYTSKPEAHLQVWQWVRLYRRQCSQL